MKVFANREIEFIQAVLVWAWHWRSAGHHLAPSHVSSFSGLLWFLLLGGCLGAFFSYFQGRRASGTGSPANPKVVWIATGCTTGLRPGGELYRLFHAVNALAAVANARRQRAWESVFEKYHCRWLSAQSTLKALNIYNGGQDEAVSPSESDLQTCPNRVGPRPKRWCRICQNHPAWMPVRSSWKTKMLLKWCGTSRGSITIMPEQEQKKHSVRLRSRYAVRP